MINLFVAMLIGFHSRMIAHMAVSVFLHQYGDEDEI